MANLDPSPMHASPLGSLIEEQSPPTISALSVRAHPPLPALTDNLITYPILPCSEQGMASTIRAKGPPAGRAGRVRKKTSRLLEVAEDASDTYEPPRKTRRRHLSSNTSKASTKKRTRRGENSMTSVHLESSVFLGSEAKASEIQSSLERPQEDHKEHKASKNSCPEERQEVRRSKEDRSQSRLSNRKRDHELGKTSAMKKPKTDRHLSIEKHSLLDIYSYKTVECIEWFPDSHLPSHTDSEPRARKPRNLRTLAQVTSTIRNSGTSDPHMLVDCADHGSGFEQPFRIFIHPKVLLLTELHSHIAKPEIIGLCGGRFDSDANILYIETSFACDSTDRKDNGATDVEMDPVCLVACVEKMRKLDQHPVAWYHSHPRFRAEPSLTDIEMQYDQQQLYGSYFVGLIISPCSDQPSSKYRVFNVTANERVKVPMALSFTVPRVPASLHTPWLLDVIAQNTGLDDTSSECTSNVSVRGTSGTGLKMEMEQADSEIFVSPIELGINESPTTEMCQDSPLLSSQSEEELLVAETLLSMSKIEMSRQDRDGDGEVKDKGPLVDECVHSQTQAIYEAHTTRIDAPAIPDNPVARFLAKNTTTAQAARKLLHSSQPELQFLAVCAVGVGLYYASNPARKALPQSLKKMNTELWIEDMGYTTQAAKEFASHLRWFLEHAWKELKPPLKRPPRDSKHAH